MSDYAFEVRGKNMTLTQPRSVMYQRLINSSMSDLEEGKLVKNRSPKTECIQLPKEG